MQKKLMGAIRNVKTMVNEQLAAGSSYSSGGTQQQQHRQERASHQQVAPDLDFGYITPRIIGMGQRCCFCCFYVHTLFSSWYG